MRDDRGKSPFDFFLFPADKIAFDGIEIHADDMDIPFVEQILFEIFFFFDLFKRCWVVIQFELKDVDRLRRLGQDII